MKVITASAVVTALSLFSSVTALAGSNWSVGEEREIKPGHYVSLYGQENGWRVWREVRKDGHDCSAAKAVMGNPDPEPLGEYNLFSGGRPFVTLDYSYKGYIQWHMWGSWVPPRIKEYRVVGAKFFTDEPGYSSTQDPYLPFLKLEGARVELHVVSYQYDNIAEGMADDAGVIDLTGITEAQRLLAECQAKPD